MNAENDAELALACRNGDSSVFDTLVERYQRPIFNGALRIVNDYEDAKDITQIVFLKAYENLGSYDPRFKFYTWIYRIAVNESINHLKRKGRLEPIDDATFPSSGANPEDLMALGELRAKVQGALMNLPADYRAVVVLKHVMNCSYRDIGEIVRIPEKTVKSRLFTARQLLKDQLSRKDSSR